MKGWDEFERVLNSPALRAVVKHWDQARGDRIMPTWADLSSSALSPHFQLLWGFHHDPQSNEYTGLIAGGHVSEWLGANFWGARLQDIHPPHVVEEARRFFDKILTEPAAGWCSGRLFTMAGRAVTGERIALPIAADGIRAGGILGATDYEYLPVTGPVELIHENVDWFSL
jgi:hypothetical protein